MSWQSTEDAIRQRWVAQIVSNTTPPLETIYENQEKTTPENQRWARLTILPAESIQVSIGSVSSNRFRQPGLVIAQLFEEIGLGTKNINILADLILTSFRTVTASGVTYRTPSIVRVGRSNNWWQLNVNCPFYADELV